MKILLTALPLIFSMTGIQAETISVDCTLEPAGSLNTEISLAQPGTTINVSGTCHESLNITTNDITLRGNANGTKTIISGNANEDRIIVDGAIRVSLIGFVIKNGLVGIKATNKARINLTDVNTSNNISGIEIKNKSTATLSGEVNVIGNAAYGVEVLTGSKLVLNDSTKLNISENFLGSQVSAESTLFADKNSEVNIYNNTNMGLSINSGSTAILLNAKLNTNNNGLNGLNIVSNTDLEVDRESELINGIKG